MSSARLLALAAAATLSAACAHAPPSSPARPGTLVLVHGAFADRRAFDGVAPLLAARGWKVVAPDLPGHGADATAAAGITLDTYVETVRGVVAAEGPVVLVGHSMAGMVVSQVAELEPAKVRAVVYVAAYLPVSGETLEQLAATDAGSLVGKNLEFAKDWTTASIRREAVAEAVAADLPAEVQGYIVAGQRPEPLKPFRGAVTLTAGRFGAVPKAYLGTSEDRAVTPALQSRMLARYPRMPVATLPTSHLPFVARPEAFVEALLRLAAEARAD